MQSLLCVANGVDSGAEETALRALIVYVVVLLLLRTAGKRTMADVTTFDLVLLLIISEATQQSLLGDDFFLTTAALVIATLIALDRLADYLSYRWPFFSKSTSSRPMVVMADGKVLPDRMRKTQLKESDTLQAARESHGLGSLDQTKYAVLETSCGISVTLRT
ncbi:YetF domain-containing protein [Streptomyces sp. NPDC006267]|uniref:DUF421 domain-containing protein n=1 Tax=Streptomyces sp. NPDC006267 TaxID=3157173 RepID=UPI0033A47649